MDSQEHLLTKFSRVLWVLNRSIDQMPNQALVALHQLCKCSGIASEGGLHQCLILIHTRLDTPAPLSVAAP